MLTYHSLVYDYYFLFSSLSSATAPDAGPSYPLGPAVLARAKLSTHPIADVLGIRIFMSSCQQCPLYFVLWVILFCLLFSWGVCLEYKV